VSRIITGKLEIERVPVMVAPLVDTVVAGALPAASARQITITRSGTGDLPLVEGDPKRLHQVFGNVLSNAVKFTPDGGRIELACDVEGTWLSVLVRDSGVGIPADFLPYVFDRFRQADSRSTRKHGGLGLGLAIARHLVERHGGEMLAHSDGPACGTTITIRLPAVSAAPYDVLVPVRHAPPAEDLRFDGVTVIVVDDQRDSRELVAALLERVRNGRPRRTALDAGSAADRRHCHAGSRRLSADAVRPGARHGNPGHCCDLVRTPGRSPRGAGGRLRRLLRQAD
jgi:anti-sigma regulatory factor (Ser/Thr protein kinase)